MVFKKGYKESAETKKKRGSAISKAKKGCPATSGSFKKGYKVAKEVREKIKKTLKKKYKTGERKPALLGKHHTTKTKKLMSKSHKGINIWSKEKTLEKNPNWKGGKSFEPYDRRFTEKFKKSIRKRDNYICLKCGVHQKDMKYALSIHHIDYNKLSTILKNCCSLCKRCNGEVNSNRKHWIKFFQSILSKKYGYKYPEI